MFGINKIDSGLSSWRSCTLVHNHMVTHLIAKKFVFSDSVLCLGGNGDEYPRSATAWAERTEDVDSTHQDRE